MQRYVARRVALSLPTIVVIMVVVFSMTRLVPGDAVDVLMDGGGFYGENDAETIRTDLGLDKPVVQAFGEWSWALFQGDLGDSLFTKQPVRTMLFDRFKVTAELALLSIIIGLVVALPIGIVGAVMQGSAVDYLVRSFSIMALSIPTFWMGTVVVLYGAVWFSWIPPLRYVPITEDPIGNLMQFLIPATVIGVNLGAVTMRMLRAMLLETLREDYVRTAYAKGLQARKVIVGHALRNALLPVVTVLGLQVAVVISGTVITETIFNLPGLGTMVVDAVARRDYPVLQGVVIFVAGLIILINLLVDLSYAYLDPRVRSSY